LGDLKLAQAEILVDLLLSFRDVSAWDQMVRISDQFPSHLKENVMVRQQRALALNRRNGPGDRDEAQRILQKILDERGADPETLGILGRVHKDRYKDLSKTGDIMADAALDDAIDAYRKGFESDPRDYYPGVNAINLMIQKGDAASLEAASKLVPLVSFAVARRGGASSADYWDLATVLELAAIGSDWAIAKSVLPKTLAAAKASWQIKTTLDNLLLLKKARESAGQGQVQLDPIIGYLDKRYEQLCGQEPTK
jgi:hypothetical protein